MKPSPRVIGSQCVRYPRTSWESTLITSKPLRTLRQRDRRFVAIPSTESIRPDSEPPSSPADQPTSFANGRYQVQRFLGEGCKKKVYLAQDTLLDREVARLSLDMGLRVGLHVETLPAT